MKNSENNIEQLDLSCSEISATEIVMSPEIEDAISTSKDEKVRPRHIREGRRTHLDLRSAKSTKNSTRPLDREIEKADMERHDDYTDLDPFASSSFLIVPQQYVDKFYDAGWHIQFVHEKDYYGKGRLGFVPVMLEELPEWATAGLPCLDSSTDISRTTICRSIDQILMKIPLEKYARLTRSVDKQRERVERVKDKFLDNGLNYERGMNPRHSMTLKAPPTPTQNIRERSRG